jgi:hypothetical protein
LAYGLSKLPSQEHAIPCFILDSCPGILFQEKRACKKCKCNSAFFVTLSSAPQFSFWTSFGISSGSSWGKEIRHFDISCILFLINFLRKFIEAIGELRKYLFSGPVSAVPFPVLPYLNCSLLIPTALTLQAL